MRALMRWLWAMIGVYADLLVDPRVNDRAKVTSLIAILAVFILFGPKALFVVFLFMIVFALHDETLQSKIRNKLRK